ncbi:MAG TPA: peroxiredoxin [Candidatus Binatia bacterium]|jgi:peroxiredoxin Q/BCP|nr:peroxiredoxin [Candidatus Binatia bacterium]
MTKMPKQGEPAPNFRSTADDGRTVSLGDYAGKNVILYFYPKANTPGCTNEATEFRDRISTFEKLNTAIIGCSGDSTEAQTRFKKKYNLNFPLLADTEHKVIDAYDAARMKSFLGKSFLGIARITYWIGPDAVIRRVWEKVTAKGHAAEVLAAVEQG